MGCQGDEIASGLSLFVGKEYSFGWRCGRFQRIVSEKYQLPFALVRIVADDIKATVVTDKLEISVVRCQPAVLDGNDADVACPHGQAPWRLFVPIAGIAVDPDLHLSAGHDNSRVALLLFLLLFLHLSDLFYHSSHFLFHGLGKCLDGFCQIVGHQLGLQG